MVRGEAACSGGCGQLPFTKPRVMVVQTRDRRSAKLGLRWAAARDIDSLLPLPTVVVDDVLPIGSSQVSSRIISHLLH